MIRAARLFLIAAGLATVPLAAHAQTGSPDAPIEEASADLGYGFCPLLLAGQFPLEGNEMLDSMGFDAKITAQANPRFGEIQMRGATRKDGVLAFGGAAQKICTVVASGDRRASVLERWRHDMPMMGIDFTPDAGNPREPKPGIKVELFKGRTIDGTMLNLQLVETAEGDTPASVLQMWVTEN